MLILFVARGSMQMQQVSQHNNIFFFLPLWSCCTIINESKGKRMGSELVRKSLGVAKTSCLKDMRHLFRLANLTEVHLVQLGGRKADSYCYQQTSCIMEKLWWPWLELAGGWLVGGWVPSGKDERDWCSLLSKVIWSSAALRYWTQCQKTERSVNHSHETHE